MAVTSTSSTIRRHDKPYDPSSYISGTQGDNKTNGENNRTRGPHTIVGLTFSSSTKDSFSATLTQTRKNVLSCRLNPACGVGGRQPMTQDESRAHLLSTVLGRHQTAWCHGFARLSMEGIRAHPEQNILHIAVIQPSAMVAAENRMGSLMGALMTYQQVQLKPTTPTRLRSSWLLQAALTCRRNWLPLRFERRR